MSIHLFWSVFFVVCNMVLVLSYLFAGIVIITIVYAVVIFFQELRYSTWDFAVQEAIGQQKSFMAKTGKSKTLLYIILFVLTFHVFMYMGQRSKWMGEDNAHLTAKEYWVAGQVVYSIRMFSSKISHPDAYFIQPFTWLQNWIYKKGIPHLPQDDGEFGVWTDIWFIYPYSWDFSNMRGVYRFKPHQKMMDLVDRAWRSLACQAKFPFADRQMKEQYHYRNFPGQAFYYIAKQGWLTGKFFGSRRLSVKSPKLMARKHQLLMWLLNLKAEWHLSSETLEFLDAHPKVEAMMQLTLQMTAGDILFESIFSRKFNCKSKAVQDYIRFRKMFIGDGISKTALQRMSDKNQAKTLYGIAVETLVSQFWSEIFDRFCNVKVPGKIREEKRDKFLGSSFNEEIKILEEIYHGR